MNKMSPVVDFAGDTIRLTKMDSTGQRVKLHHSQRTRAYPATRSQKIGFNPMVAA